MPRGTTPPFERTDPELLKEVTQALLAWYRQHGRDLPWRRTADPYAILVSEVMLQQTQVQRVIPKYREFLQRFPTLQELAAAPIAEVIRLWSPLGYNQRAVRLQAVARQCVQRFGGRLPSEAEDLLSLKGIGRYTAGAVLCFAYRRPAAVLDTNLRRVLFRVFVGYEGFEPPLTEKAAWSLAEAVLPEEAAYEWNQGLMDLGAGICTAKGPNCAVCPLKDSCRAHAQVRRACPEPRRRDWAAPSPKRIAEPRRRYEPAPFGKLRTAPFVGSNRYYRGRIVEHLRALEPGQSVTLSALGAAIKPDFAEAEGEWLAGLVTALARDGLALLRPSAEGLRSPPDSPNGAAPNLEWLASLPE